MANLKPLKVSTSTPGAFQEFAVGDTVAPSIGGTGADNTPADGHILIGSTAGGDYVDGQLTSTGGTLTVTEGSGTLNADLVTPIPFPNILNTVNEGSSSFNATVGNMYLCAIGAGTPVCTLPTAVGVAGQIIGVILTGSPTGRLTFATTSSQTINNVAASSFVGIISAGMGYLFISDGSNWYTFATALGTGNANQVFTIGGATAFSWKGPITTVQGGTGTTLFTHGQATFSSSNSVTVTDATITASSIVVVTVVAGTAVAEEFSVSVSAGSGFTIHSTNVASTATVNYIRVA